MIAANRWGFTNYCYTGEFQDLVIMQEYHRILQHCPGLSNSPLPPGTRSMPNRVADSGGRCLAQGRGRGRPRTSPRAMLDAILWKLATGHSWDSLPSGFPPMHLCRNYYRRLFYSGRWYTLILALYNHFRMESYTDLHTLLGNGVFTTTPSQKIALNPHVPLTWENCTALLFMQLACSSWSRLRRVQKQSKPLYPIYPVLKGSSSLTTGLPHGLVLSPRSSEHSLKRSLKHSSNPSTKPLSALQVLEESCAWNKWLKLEQDQQTIARELSHNLDIASPPASVASSPPFQESLSLKAQFSTFHTFLSPSQESGGVSPGNAYNQPMNNLTQLSQDYTRIAQAIIYIETNVPRQPDLNEVAAHIGLSQYHFQRLFTRWAGISPKRFLQFLTRENAKALLSRSSNLLETTYATGLSSPGRLHDLFVQTEAVTPGEYKSKGTGVDIVFGFHATPFGECLLALTGRGICFLAFIDHDHSFALGQLRQSWPNAALTEDPTRTAPVLDRIFSPGSGSSLTLNLRGTNFQIKVWEALLRLPAGQVTSYELLAEQVSTLRAARPVGNAVAHNPVAYLIPCHRVLQKSGGFGNYRYGPVRKKAILGWEMAREEKT